MSALRLVRSALDPRPDLLPTAQALDDAARFADERHGPLGVSPVAVVRVPRLDRLADPSGAARVWLALESLQITGSFKVRGALLALARLVERGARRVVAASAGNHGAGVAFAARALGVEATVVVPSGAPEKKVSAIEGAGAVVVAHEGGYDAAEAHAKRLAAERGDPFLSPYDDLDVVAGNGGGLGLEIAGELDRRGARAGIVLAPFGGGGLATGLACAFARAEGAAYGAARRVWGVQSEASPAFARSLEAGEAIEVLEGGPTLADGLEGGIARSAFARAAGVVAGVLVSREERIADAMDFAERELGLMLEGSAAVALVPILDGLPGALRSQAEAPADCVAVLTGRNVDRARPRPLVC